jgi:hypothetical protein
MGSIEYNGSIEYPDRNLLKKRYDGKYPALEQERDRLEKRLRMLLEAESVVGTVKGQDKVLRELLREAAAATFLFRT